MAQSKLIELEKELNLKGDRLSRKRREGAKALERAVVQELKGLKISHPVFEVRISAAGPETPFLPSGKDQIRFLISMNPGVSPDEISKVASGGELSRIMLVLKSISASAETIPTVVFDEIDSGVGGEVAESIGKKLKRLSKEKQVFCITHLPQIASFGKQHFNITKKSRSGATEIFVTRLDLKERIQEIGRMLGGSNITPKTLKLAEELITLNQKS